MSGNGVSRRAERLVARIAAAIEADQNVAVLVTGYDVTQPVVEASFRDGIVSLLTDEGNLLMLAPEVLVGVMTGPDANTRAEFYHAGL